MLSRDDILALGDSAEFDILQLPNNGGEIGIKRFSGIEFNALMGEWDKLGGEGTNQPSALHAAVVAASACDQRGEPLFQGADKKALGKLPAETLMFIAEAVMVYNKLTEKGKEEIKGKSKSKQTGDSGTCSL